MLSMIACGNKKNQTENFQINKAKKLTYLALGDSYTIGESVKKSERWPIQLKASLIDNNILLNTTIIAKTGWRTDNLLKAAQNQISDQKYDLVSLLIGVNNEYQGEDSDGFKSKFKACLDYAVAHSKKGNRGLFVVSIPDYGFTPFGKSNQEKISARLIRYNSICESVCEREEVTFINITPISQNGLKDDNLIASDGLHPSGKQYQLWVDWMLPKIIQLIQI